MSKIAFIFPGQGAQKVGMGQEFYEQFPSAKKTMEDANAVVELDLFDLCYKENELINDTAYTQPAMVATCIAMANVVMEQGIKPDVCAGLSLGAYAALEVCGALSLQEAVTTVAKRGQLMKEAVPDGSGSMAAVLGLESHLIEEALANETKVTIANYNCPGQIVITGDGKRINELIPVLQEAGAKRVLPLKVSGPFHSPYLIEAGQKLGKVLEDIDIKKLTIPYVSNIDGAFVGEKEQVKERLVKQVSSSVRWQQSIETMIANGVDTFIEIGPGKTLTGFMKKINKEVKSYSIQTPKDLEKVVKECASC